MIQLSLSKRICYHYPYVMLAATLSADAVDEEDTSNLRADASNEGICYIHVIRSLDDGLYLVRVAARPELLKPRREPRPAPSEVTDGLTAVIVRLRFRRRPMSRPV